MEASEIFVLGIVSRNVSNLTFGKLIADIINQKKHMRRMEIRGEEMHRSVA